MAAVRFDNFEWHKDSDPFYDEGHADIELPITNPSTGQNYIAVNEPLFFIQPIFTQAQFLEYQILHPDPYSQLPYGTESITFKLRFNYIDNLTVPQIWEMPGRIDLTQYTRGYWINARYQLTQTYSDINPDLHLHTDYWVYLVGSNYDLILENQLSSSIKHDDFLPVIILMQDKVWYDVDAQSDLHVTTNKMLKKLAIKGADIKEAFLEQEADPNHPDNDAEKWDFFMHFAVPINTKITESIEYMFKFFERILPFQQHDFADYQAYLGTGGGIYYPQPGSFVGYYRWYRTPQPLSTIHITEGGVTGYDALYGWSYIAEKTFPGQYKNLKPREAKVDAYECRQKHMTAYLVGLREMHGTDILHGKPGDHEENGYHDYIIFTKQFADYGPDGELLGMYYRRILVMSLSLEYTINTRTDQGTGGMGDGPHKLQKVDMSLFDLEAPYGTPSESFRLAVSVATLKAMPWLHREPVISDSLAYTVFLVDKVKVKWYEKGFFKVFIIIIAVILIIVLAIYGLEGIAVNVANFIVGGTASALTVFVVYFVLSFAIGFIFSMAGSAIGGIWGVVFVAVASYLTAGAGTGNTIPGSWGNAINYLNKASPYLIGGQKIYSYYVTDQLAKDWEIFTLNAREKEQQLEDAWANLDTPGWIDPLYLVRSSQYRAESPSDYLSRTKDPNPGVTANKLVYNFTRLAIKLPEEPMEKDLIQEMFIGFNKQSGGA